MGDRLSSGYCAWTVALSVGALLFIQPPKAIQAQPAAPSPEQPDWQDERPSPAPTKESPSATNAPPVAPAIRDQTDGSTSPSPPDAEPAADSQIGVPSAQNFFLPDFDTAGRPLFERQGLRFRVGPVNLRMSLTLGEEYNNNIFGTQADKTADYISKVTPGFLLGLGDFKEKTEDFLVLSYQPTFQYYQTQTQQNGINQNLEVTGQTTLSRYSTTVDLSYQTNNQPNATQNGGQDYGNLNFSWDNRYYLGGKTFTRLAVNSQIQSSENQNNYQTYSVSPQLGYAFTPKTTLIFGPFAGFSNTGDGNSQTFQGLSVGVNYTNLRKLQVEASFGVQARQFNTKNSADSPGSTGATNFITPVFNVGITYAGGPNTNVTLNLIRNVQLSDYQRGLTYTNNEIDLGFGQRIWNRLGFSLGLSYQYLQYQGDAVTTGRTDQYISIGPALSYTFWRDLFNLTVFYRQQYRTSEIEQFNYEVTSYGISLSYRF